MYVRAKVYLICESVCEFVWLECNKQAHHTKRYVVFSNLGQTVAAALSFPLVVSGERGLELPHFLLN